MKRVPVVFLVLSLFLSLTSTPTLFADTSQPDESLPIMTYCSTIKYACDGYIAESPEQYLPPWSPGFRNYQGYYRNDLAGLYRFPSYAIAITRGSDENATDVVACKDISANDCVGTQINFVADLPMCSNTVVIDCLRDINIEDANNRPLNFSVEGEFPKGNPTNFKGSTSLKVPDGGGSTLIHIPDAPHKGGDTYLIKAQMVGMKSQGQTDFDLQNFAVSITAVKLIEGKFTYGGTSVNPKLFTKGFNIIGDEKGTYPGKCAAASPTQCAARYSLPMGLRFGLSVDLSRKITGWLHGRIKSPQVEVTTNPAGGSSIKMSGEPIKIPVNSVWVNNDQAAKSIKDFYAGKPNFGEALFGPENKSKPLSEIALMRDGNSGHNLETLNEYLAWLQTLGDKAQALPTAWSIQTMSNNEVSDQIQSCLQKTDSLAGIVTTNAAEYLDGPPVFDKTEGTLDYKVAATHFEPDGTTVLKGTYDLVMSSSVARCIYGFTNAPISATVSVTSENGASNVATTVVSEKAGWLSLGAYNFTYSAPTISVKLIGTVESAIVVKPEVVEPPKVVNPEPVKPAVTKPAVVLKKTLCIKGKVTKTVKTGKCPAGYKKK